ALRDGGHVPAPEPFQRLVNQGMIVVEEYHLAPDVYAANKDRIAGLGLEVLRWEEDGEETYVLRNPQPADSPDKFCPLTEEQVAKEKGKTLLKGTAVELTVRADKMSKSRHNVINPDEVVEEYGADSLRLYEMFMGPLEASQPWNMRGVEGVSRFLGRVCRQVIGDLARGAMLDVAVRG